MKAKTAYSNLKNNPSFRTDLFQEEIVLKFGFKLGMNVFRGMANEMLNKFNSLTNLTDKEIEDYFKFEIYFTVANILLFYGVCPKVLTQFIALRLSDIRSSLENPKYSAKEFKDKLFVLSTFGRKTHRDRDFYIITDVYELCIADGISLAKAKKEVLEKVSPVIKEEAFKTLWTNSLKTFKDCHQTYKNIIKKRKGA